MLKEELKLALKNAIEDSIAKTAVIKQLEADVTKTAAYQVLLEKYTACSNALIDALAKNVVKESEMVALRTSNNGYDVAITSYKGDIESMRQALRKALSLVRVNVCGGYPQACPCVTDCLCKQWWDTVATGEPCVGRCEGCNCNSASKSAVAASVAEEHGLPVVEVVLPEPVEVGELMGTIYPPGHPMVEFTGVIIEVNDSGDYKDIILQHEDGRTARMFKCFYKTKFKPEELIGTISGGLVNVYHIAFPEQTPQPVEEVLPPDEQVCCGGNTVCMDCPNIRFNDDVPVNVKQPELDERYVTWEDLAELIKGVFIGETTHRTWESFAAETLRKYFPRRK